jgi:primosomal replication protein N''
VDSDNQPYVRVLQAYLERLRSAIARGPLLNADGGAVGRGSLMDLTHLNNFRSGQADGLLDRLLDQRTSVRVQPDWNLLTGDEDDEDREKAITKLYRQVDQKFVRMSRRIERETGNRCLWLGYPILSAAPLGEPHRAVLAPVYLWPVNISLDAERQSAFVIRREADDEGPVFNQIMAAWIERRLGKRIRPPENAKLRSRSDIEDLLRELLSDLPRMQMCDLSDPLSPVPSLRSVREVDRSALFNGGVIGLMRWQHQSIMEDIERLMKAELAEDSPVRHFLEGRALGQASAFPTYESECDRHHVTAADYSQEEAILKTRFAPGVVIHGPPGTGKSQTITNLVSDALARNERVLVVCQKRAAIDVVANRLTAAGLDDLFMMIHDAESDRQQTIRSLKEQLSDLQSGLGSNRKHHRDRDNLCRSIEQHEQNLDQIHRAMHCQRRCGATFSQIVGVLAILEHGDIRPTEDKDIGSLLQDAQWNELQPLCKQLERLGDLHARCEPETNPWSSRCESFRRTPQSNHTLQQLLSIASEADVKHCEQLHGDEIPIDRAPDEFRDHAEKVLGAMDELLESEDVPSILLCWGRWQGDEHAANIISELQTALSGLDELDQPRIAGLSVPELSGSMARDVEAAVQIVLEYQHRLFARIGQRYRKAKKTVAPLCKAWGVPYRWDELHSIFTILRRRFLRDSIGELIAASIPEEVLSQFTQSRDEDVIANRARKVLDWWLNVRAVTESCEGLPTVQQAVDKCFRSGSPNDVQACRDRVHCAIERCGPLMQLERAIVAFNEMLSRRVLDEIVKIARAGRSIRESLSAIESGFSCIDDLIGYEREYRQLSDRDRSVVNCLVKSKELLGDEKSSRTRGESWSQTVAYSALIRWWREILGESPELEYVDEEQLDSLRTELAQFLDQKHRLEPLAIRADWHNWQQPAVRQPWNQVLILGGPNARRLRQVVRMGRSKGLFDLRPVWLTNPETACRIFDLEQGLFDLVVFDEASQLPMEQAVPVLYRGKRIVVAGDEHQLPPTTFFQSSISTDGDDLDGLPSIEEEGEDADATVGGSEPVTLEGIQLATGASDLLTLSQQIMPEHVLAVHYRSRHPALIEFSNQAFYGGRLEAAHPQNGIPRPEAAPIRIHRVDGEYHNRQNVDEAKYIVKLLDHIWRKPGTSPTIGVVTFNSQQEKLIEEELERKAREDHQFEARFRQEQDRRTGEEDVGFFVKNLESVQGDERDLIIFSTTFGRSSSGGGFKRWFGPLSTSGGERRLNVAVTRSKQGMLIVTSMPFGEVSDIAGGVAPGRRIKARDFLQAYMSYAQSVSDADLDQMDLWLDRAAQLRGEIGCTRGDRLTDSFDSPFEEAVHERLMADGWQVDTQVGDAGFLIDLAVRHPDPVKGYLLGIECDGATYHRDWSARIRDVWRQQILEARGWSIFRIWSTQWWMNPERVMADLNERLDQVLRDMDGRETECLIPAPFAAPRAAVPTEPEPSGISADDRFIEEIPEDQEPEIAQHVASWSAALENVLRGDHEAEIATWADGGQGRYQLMVERHRGRRMLQLLHDSEVVRHFAIVNINDGTVNQMCDGLRAAKNRADIYDWFERARRTLHPDSELVE